MIVHKSHPNIIKFSDTNVLLLKSVVMHKILGIISFILEAMFQLVRKYFL